MKYIMGILTADFASLFRTKCKQLYKIILSFLLCLHGNQFLYSLPKGKIL